MPKHIRNGKVVGGAIGIARNLFFDKSKKNLLTAENVQDAVDELSEKKSDVSIKQTSGDFIHLTDSVESGLVVSNAVKNLLKYDLDSLKEKNTAGTWVDNAYTLDGVTFTINSDMSITINGTNNIADKRAVFRLLNGENSIPKDGLYMLSIKNGGSGIALKCIMKPEATNSVGYTETMSNKIDTTKEGTPIICSIMIGESKTVNNITVYPLLEEVQDGQTEPSPYTPANYDIVSCGRNLISKNSRDKNCTEAGIRFTNNEDGSVTMNGTATATPVTFCMSTQYIKAGRYRMTGINHVNVEAISAIFVLEDVKTKGRVDLYENNREITVDESGIYSLKIRITKDTVLDNVTDYPMLCLASDDVTEYEPYEETKVSITPETEFPVYGLKAFDGVTNVASEYGTLNTIQHATNETGATLLSYANRLAEQQATIDALSNAINILAGQAGE